MAQLNFSIALNDVKSSFSSIRMQVAAFAALGKAVNGEEIEEREIKHCIYVLSDYNHLIDELGDITIKNMP